MFMSRPPPPPSTPTATASSTVTPHKMSKAEKKALKKTNSRHSTYENISTLGRHHKSSSRSSEHDGGFEKPEPATRSASADDFLAPTKSDDNVFCSSTAASPDMSAIHLPPKTTGSSSLRISSVRRRSMSELVRLSNERGEVLDTVLQVYSHGVE